MCCFAPVGAMSATIEYVTVIPNSGQFSSTVNITSDQVAAIESGNGMVITGLTPVGSSALNIAGNLQVFDTPDVSALPGTLFISDSVSNGTGDFTIQADGAVSIDGMMVVNSPNRLFVVSSYTAGNTFDMTVGGVLNQGKLFVEDVDNFTSGGTIVSNGILNVSANTLDLKMVAVDGGSATFSAKKQASDASDVTLSVEQLVNNSADDASIVLDADVISAGTIQNNATAGNIVIGVAGDDATQSFTSTGNVENSGNGMTINAAAANVVVDGIMKNTNGKMLINAANLTVNGGSADGYSFFNNGQLQINVSGTTTLANGFELNMMQNTYGNSFALTTGNLDLGTNSSDLFANELNSFSVKITEADYLTGNVSNGLINQNANMYFSAQNLTVGNVVNNAVAQYGLGGLSVSGSMDLVATDGTLTVGSLSDVVGADTTLMASDIVNVGGAVNSKGSVFVSGPVINIGTVEKPVEINNSGNLSLLASSASGGALTAFSNVTNAGGELKIDGQQVALNGNVVNKNDAMLIIDGARYDDSFVRLGGLDVVGGSVSLNTIDGVNIAQSDTFGTGTLSVTGGALVLGNQVHTLDVAAPQGNLINAVYIGGNLSAVSSADNMQAGDVSVLAGGTSGFTLTSNGDISIGGSITSVESGASSRSIKVVASNGVIDITGGVNAKNSNKSVSLSGTSITAGGDVVASNNGVIYLSSNNIVVGSLTDNELNVAKGGAIYVQGVADSEGNQQAVNLTVNGDVVIKNGLSFNPATANSGLIVSGTNAFSLISQGGNSDINISGGIDGFAGSITLQSNSDIIVKDAVSNPGALDVTAGNTVDFKGAIITSGAFNVDAKNGISLADISNTGNVSLETTGGNITTGIVNTGLPETPSVDANYGMTFSTADDLDMLSFEVSGGIVDITADSVAVNSSASGAVSGNMFVVNGGTVNLNVKEELDVNGGIRIVGDLYQGTNKSGALNLLTNKFNVYANGLAVTEGFVADKNSVTYDISGNVSIAQDISIDGSADVAFYADVFTADNVENASNLSIDVDDYVKLSDVINTGALDIVAGNGIDMGSLQNSGSLTLNTGGAVLNVYEFQMNAGIASFMGAGLNATGNIATNGTLYHNYVGPMSAGDIYVKANEYNISASSFTVGEIVQDNGSLNIISSDVTVSGDIDVSDLTIVADTMQGKLDLLVKGSILGNTDILGLEQMTVGQDYVFDNSSRLVAEILQYDSSALPNNNDDVTTRNYWSSISLNEDDTLGQITNAADGQALVQVDGKFQVGVTYDPALSLGGTGALSDSQIGIKLTDVVDAGTAIWLLSANSIEKIEGFDNIRNLGVLFCNADGSQCTQLKDNAGAFITLRDTDGNSVMDSMYVVFDPRFGGPVLIENNKVQTIVSRQPDYTGYEIVAAGALDNLIAGQLQEQGYGDRTPIEVIPTMFKGTNLETLMTELYNRLDYYSTSANGVSLLPFASLVQPREVEQLIGSVALNTHTFARDFEDRLIDEFIWNRNKNLEKAWFDFDFGMFNQKVFDGTKIDGNRFSLTAGYDWQETKTLIWGLVGRVSHMSSDDAVALDLTYVPGKTVLGNVSVDVADTNVGFGAYLLKTLFPWARVYGNAFADIHLFDIKREQTFVDSIEGSGTSFALTSEWGFMHDWLNQYIVGNLYVRAGYDSGFSITEQAGGSDYMELESKRRFMLTPGYSLTAQKRIYPTSWFQIRPYATIGVEYDAFGTPDYAEYKFAGADVYSKYDLDIDPLWANIGAGFQFVSAGGAQVGIGYRYQYNNAIQLHNIKLSGSYRF